MAFQSTFIGVPVTRIEGPEKVTGQTRFAADVALPGVLWGKILRSPHPHARIQRIDALAAWRVPYTFALECHTDLLAQELGVGNQHKWDSLRPERSGVWKNLGELLRVRL